MARATANPNPERSQPPALRAGAWRSIAGLRHGFYGRAGGHSRGNLAALNLSYKVGDDPATVDRNWRTLCDSLAPMSVARVDQVHGADILEVHTAPARPISTAGTADGLVTRAAGVALAISTADCVPILLVAPSRRTVMALHAGWRGTVAGIAARGLEVGQTTLGIDAGEWQVALGPAIDGCCYEVDCEIGQRLIDAWGAMPNAWRPATSRGQLDLRQANREILLRRGVAADAVHTVGGCTACNDTDFFSHRRSGGTAGRQISLIGYNDDNAS